MKCPYCGADLSRTSITLPWEDGDNPYAYVTCPRCGEEITVGGYGEDDD